MITDHFLEGSPMKLKNPVALVTGASSGIGKATAERLATAGYKVYGTSRRGATSGQRAFEMLSLDVTSDESAAAVGGAARPPRQQRRVQHRPRRSGRKLDRTGARDLRDELLRDGPDDGRRRAAHATPRGWSHHQHRLRAGLLAGAIHGPLCRHQARGRRLFGITRP